MKNKYGNFVILKVLQTSEMEDKTAVMQSLLKNVNAVNTTKYKNRWIQFIEENPMKVPGFNSSLPVKPSLFKQAPHHFHSNNDSDDNLSRHSDDAGWGGDDWNDPRQQQQQQDRKKNFNKNAKEEKSQFFYNSNKPNMGNYPMEYEDDRFGFNMMHHHHQHQPQDNVGYTNSPGMRGGQNPGGYNNNKNKGRNMNPNNQGGQNNQQRQFVEKQGQGQGKWGYNSFY